MSYILNKKLRDPKEPEFIVINEYAQVFSGLKGGYPVFSDDWDEAKPLKKHEQFTTLQRVSPVKIEKYFL
jgi:hypothetical protein